MHNAVVNTRTAEHRTLHFDSIDDLLAEVDRIVAADRAGSLRRTGNWTTGQIFAHIAAWANYPYEGYPPGATPPWFVRIIARMMRKRFVTRPMSRGFRIPRAEHGTFGVEDASISTEEGARRLRDAMARLQRREAAIHHSPALGPMSEDDRIALNLRHAELHLGFLCA